MATITSSAKSSTMPKRRASGLVIARVSFVNAKTLLAAGAFYIFFIALVVGFFYPTMSSLNFSSYLGSNAVAGLVGAKVTNLSSFSSLLALELYSSLYALIWGGIIAYMAGASIPATIENGTIDLALSRPISRTHYFLELWLSAIMGAIFLSLTTALSVWITTLFVKNANIDWGWLAIAELIELALMFMASGIGMLFASFMNASRAAGGAALGIIGLAYLMNTAGALTDKLTWMLKIEPLDWSHLPAVPATSSPTAPPRKVSSCPTSPPEQLAPLMEAYKALGETIRRSPLPISILSNTCTDLTPFGRTIADEAGIHFVGGMEHGMTALGHALWWYEAAAKAQHASQTIPSAQETPTLSITMLAPPTGSWSEYTARTFLQNHGIPVVPGRLTTSAEDAVQAAQHYGFPIAMKIVARDILHKSDIGGVLLNVNSADAVRQSFAAIMHTVKHQTSSQTIEGILVSPMRPIGRELLVGILSDPSWGQTLVLGLGGIWTEIFNDTSVRVLPMQRDGIRTMLAELRGAALLQGLRGQSASNIEQVVEVIYRITQIAQALQKHLDTLEINPLLLSDTGVEVLDVLLTWKI